jgi:hypothetical protein
MIVTCLNGGLGNQMFQYAAARSLADKINEELKLDTRDLSRFSISGFRKKGVVFSYGLGEYPIRATLANSLLLNLHGYPVSRRARFFLKKNGLSSRDYILEREFTYQALSAVPGHFSYLEGYWQSWKYFQPNRKRILRDFTLRQEAAGRNAEMLRKIQKENSICVHVRLGDYVRSKATAAAHGNLTPDYYRAALHKLKGAGSGLSCYLFSDEPREALRLLGNGIKMTVVDHNVGRPHEDLRLMSACKCFITANSSFSWWGAWLSERPGKRVVAPKRWFAGLGHDTRDLVPKDWVRL